MGKITISVCRAYKNSGRFRSHRKKTKPAWKHYFVSNDYTDELTCGTEWVDSVTAQFLKLKKRYKRYFVCFECGGIFRGYVKKNEKVFCPRCSDKEDEEDE